MFRPLLTILAVLALTAHTSPGVFRYSHLRDGVCDTFSAQYKCPAVVKGAIPLLKNPETLPSACYNVRAICILEELSCPEISAEDSKKVAEACFIESGGGTTSRPSPTEEPEYTTASPPTGTTEDNSIHTTGTPPTPTPETEEPVHTTLPDPGIPDSDHTTASPPTGTTEDNSIHTTGTPPTPTPETEEPVHTTLPDPGIPDSDHTTASPPTGTTDDNSIHTTGTPPTPTPEPEEQPHTILPDPGIPACTSPPPTTTTRDPNAPPPTQEGYVCGGPIDVTNMPN